MIHDARHGSEHYKCDGDRGDSVCLLRQDDPVSVVVGGDKFDDVTPGHPMTMGWKAGTQCSQNEEHEARQ